MSPRRRKSRAVEPLLAKKVLKRGAKNKASGQFRYHVTKIGQKHLATPSVSTASAASSAPAPSPTA